jgi:transmembrane sensor
MNWMRNYWELSFVDTNERRKRASLDAAEWYVRLQEPDVTRTDREEFVDWLRESSLHVAEMLRIAQVNGALEQFQHWTRLSTEGPDDAGNVVALSQHPLKSEARGEPLSVAEERGAPGETARKRHSRRGLSFALAASLAGLVVLGAWIFLGLGTQTIETDRGERREVALADGSVLEVDPETRLRIRFDEDARRVTLERGRALFRVAKNPDRPFLVQADGTTVRAVGTAFGVERQKEGVVVTVAEGKVAVFATDSGPLPEGERMPNVSEAAADDGQGTAAIQPKPPTPLRRTRNRSEVFLTAGQQVTMESSGSAQPVRKVDSDRELAWAKGRLVFDNETVAGAIEEFNRYNRVQLHVVEEALAKRLVSAVFDASDPESFIAFIQTVAPVRVTRSDPMNITIAMEVK